MGQQGEGANLAYQKQLPKSLRSFSFECFLTVLSAAPVAFLWYVFCWSLAGSAMVVESFEIQDSQTEEVIIQSKVRG